jgi:hypothetical protein
MVLHVCRRLAQITVIGSSHPRFEHLQTGVSVLYVHHGDKPAVAIYSVWFQLNLSAEEEAAHCLFGPVAERLVHFRAI